MKCSGRKVQDAEVRISFEEKKPQLIRNAANVCSILVSGFFFFSHSPVNLRLFEDCREMWRRF